MSIEAVGALRGTDAPRVGRDGIRLLQASKSPMRNRAAVARCEVSADDAEVVLDIGHGKTLAATITTQSAAALDLAPGKPAFALFDAAHVIVAID